MAHHSNIEVDQSGKVEVFTDDTVIAFSNHIAYAIRIPAGVKRAAIKVLRLRGVDQKIATLHLFAAGVFLLLERHLEQVNLITIDTEYNGRDQAIRAHLLTNIRRQKPNFRGEQILFQRIGKKSPAHEIAWSVHRGAAKAERVIQYREFINALK